MKYVVYSTCERFGVTPREFRTWSAEDQIDLMAYELVRQTEERGDGNAE